MKSTAIDDLEYSIKKTERAISILKDTCIKEDLIDVKECLAIAIYAIDRASREIEIKSKILGYCDD